MALYVYTDTMDTTHNDAQLHGSCCDGNHIFTHMVGHPLFFRAHKRIGLLRLCAILTPASLTL